MLQLRKKVLEVDCTQRFDLVRVWPDFHWRSVKESSFPNVAKSDFPLLVFMLSFGFGLQVVF